MKENIPIIIEIKIIRFGPLLSKIIEPSTKINIETTKTAVPTKIRNNPNAIDQTIIISLIARS